MIIESDQSLIKDALLVNAPQLGLSLAYLCLNGLFTYMFVSHEIASYAFKRKGLRVSDPEGDQRSTYWLSLPIRMGAPLMITSILMHWLLSQALTQIQYKALIASGKQESVSWITLHLPWLVILLSVGAVVIIAPIVLGCIKSRKVASMYRHDSMSIARACEARSGIEGEAEKRLVFGVIKEAASCGECQGKAGFSAGVVDVLKNGEKYE